MDVSLSGDRLSRGSRWIKRLLVLAALAIVSSKEEIACFVLGRPATSALTALLRDFGVDATTVSLWVGVLVVGLYVVVAQSRA